MFERRTIAGSRFTVEAHFCMKIQPRVINAPNGGLQFAHCEVHDEMHWKKFAMVVAHDLKEPLRNISSCARMLACTKTDQHEERQQICDWLTSSSTRLDEMVQGLLDHARMGGEDEDVEVDLGRMVTEIQDDFRSLIRRTGAQVHVGNLPRIEAGPLGIRIVLSNLIENAIKYGRPGVQVHVDVSAKKTSEGWLLMVEDNGRGMNPQQIREVFQPFKRFACQEEGLGMGLCHVYSIVEKHGGEIRLHSEPGIGSRFELHWPD